MASPAASFGLMEEERMPRSSSSEIIELAAQAADVAGEVVAMAGLPSVLAGTVHAMSAAASARMSDSRTV